MKAFYFKWMMRIFPSYLGPGIKVTKISDDYKHLEVQLKLTWRSRNIYGTHFGGNLYSMVDPFLVLMFLNTLEKDYIIWDKEAKIKFIKPGKSTVKAIFNITEKDLELVRENTKNGEKYTPTYNVEIKDDSGNIIAIVEKTLYFKKKENKW